MAKQKFNDGDVVVLKSGGPKMTVENAKFGDGTILCKWFAGAKEQQAYFAETSLNLVPDEDAKAS